MREVSRNRKRKKNGGCAGVLVFIVFLILLFVGAKLVVKWYSGSDTAKKIQMKQYPIKYEHFVDKYSEKYGLDRYLVFAVIRTESKFDKTAISAVGAKGIMQITDETGRDCAKKIGLSNYKDQRLFDPETNIQLGCYYLSSLIKKYSNDLNAALAAYNGGPANVDGWLKDKACVDEGGRLKNIPYTETKNYVSGVNESMKMYKKIYDGEE